MKIGDPLDRSTDHGPQNHKAHLDKLVEYCETGVKEGATLVCGGKQVQRPGEAADPQSMVPALEVFLILLYNLLSCYTSASRFLL